jgi:hypothetical protein
MTPHQLDLVLIDGDPLHRRRLSVRRGGIDTYRRSAACPRYRTRLRPSCRKLITDVADLAALLGIEAGFVGRRSVQPDRRGPRLRRTVPGQLGASLGPDTSRWPSSLATMFQRHRGTSSYRRRSRAKLVVLTNSSRDGAQSVALPCRRHGPSRGLLPSAARTPRHVNA